MATLQGAYRAALNLEYAGTQDASLKLACWASILSGIQNLETGNKQAVDALRPYVTAWLDRDTLVSLLDAASCRYSGVTLDAILAVQELEAAGVLAPYASMPEYDSDWQAWRDDMVRLVPGMAYKMVSMAAYLMWPLACPFIIVDRHQLRSLGYNPDRCPRRKLGYTRIEQSLLDRYYRDASLGNLPGNMSAGAYGHYLWSLARQATGEEEASDDCADHTFLSPRLYPDNSACLVDNYVTN